MLYYIMKKNRKRVSIEEVILVNKKIAQEMKEIKESGEKVYTFDEIKKKFKL